MIWKWIIALQGAFAEHQAMLQHISRKGHLEVIQVRTPEELKRCDALIIPGGGLAGYLYSHAVRSDPLSLQSHPPSRYLRVYPG
jgi:imidazoleglycerol phosphate synthase glutamine amidotransferase subunit HisH